MALLACPECNHTVSDKAFSCPGCGYPINPHTISVNSTTFDSPISANALQRNKQKRTRKKLPNGYGSIKKLSGNRSKPYAVYPPTSSLLSYDNSRTTPALGYYTDWYSAFDALSEYHRNPYDIKARNLTFAHVYELFFKEKFKNNRKELSVSSKYAYEAAFKNCHSLHELRFADIRKQEMQSVLDDCSLGYSSVCNLKKLFGQMYKFAMENDIVEKNYAQFVTINKEDDNEKGEPFSQEELDLLWKSKDDTVVQMILIMIYSGFRIKAFETIEINQEKHYFKGGVKTIAGKGRIVPIHDAILDFSLAFKTIFPEFKVNTFRSTLFYPALECLGIAVTQNGKKHTPHDCRHTFSWLCDKYKVDELSKHLLMGHSLGKDVERAVYGHRTLEELRMEINKIKV